MKTVVDGGYLSWIFGSEPGRTRVWNGSAIIDFSRWMQAVIILEGGNLDRKKFYPEYKSHRKEQEKKDPDKKARRVRVAAFVKQLEREALVDTVKFPGLEADDVIAAWAVANYQSENTEPLQVKAIDKDFLQMGNLMSISKTDKTEVTFDNWKNHMQKTVQPNLCEPWHILLCLALLGDRSDNVPRLIPSRKLGIINDILQADNPWVAGYNMYGEDFKRNLYMTILPGAWVYEDIPTPDDTLALVAGDFALNKGFSAWYDLPLRKDIQQSFDFYHQGIAPIKVTEW